MAADRIVLGDIGGTNARFALYEAGRMGPIASMAVADHGHAADALEAFIARDPGRAPATGAVLAVAGPVEDGRCALTNSPWVIDSADLRRRFGWKRVRVINDFEALAWSLPRLAASDLFAIGGGKAAPSAPAAVLGPGTGLGLACLAPHGDGAIVIGTEGGHTTLPAADAREDAVIELLRARFGHVSAERALSGDGLVNLCRAIGSIERATTAARSAAEITEAALKGTCPVCRQALDMFCAMLGTVAGNAALAFAARGGVYIAGGIAPRVAQYLAHSRFRARFEAKGRLAGYLAAVPTWIIMHPEPAFVGLQWLAERTAAR